MRGSPVRFTMYFTATLNVHTFAGGSEQQLFDHVANVIVVVCVGSPPAIIKMKWKINVHCSFPNTRYVAVTLVCVTVIIKGVPLGVQIA